MISIIWQGCVFFSWECKNLYKRSINFLLPFRISMSVSPLYSNLKSLSMLLETETLNHEKNPFIVRKKNSLCQSLHFHTINYSATHLCKHLSTVNPNELEKLKRNTPRLSLYVLEHEQYVSIVNKADSDHTVVCLITFSSFKHTINITVLLSSSLFCF